jgi:antitoxin (DNA-binding transcriptional repressor) of toxin-antitoxin stability system
MDLWLSLGYNSNMSAYSVAEAKNNLSELIDRALKGEDILITRHGRPVVEMRAVKPAPSPVTEMDIEWLASRRMPGLQGVETPSLSLWALRDEDGV